MKKELVVKRLKATIHMLEQLTPKEFSYDSFIKIAEKIEDEKTKEPVFCTTVGCVAGHYPRHFPKAGLIIINSEYGSPILVSKKNRLNVRPLEEDGVYIQLMAYHGLSHDLIKLLFYGQLHQLKYKKNVYETVREVKEKYRNFFTEFSFTGKWIKIIKGVAASLDQVKNFFCFITELIEKDCIEY